MYIAAIEDHQYKEEKFNCKRLKIEKMKILNFNFSLNLGWNNVYGFDLSCVRQVAVTEPLIDYVHRNQVVTNYFKFKEIDLYTVTNDDLTFEENFILSAKRNDYIHAFLVFFNVEFSKAYKPFGFSTCKFKLLKKFKLIFNLKKNYFF